MFFPHKPEMLASDKNGPLNGRGSFTRPDGTVFDGEWREGIPHGHMVVTSRDGTRMITQYSHGVIQGHTIVEKPDGTFKKGWFEKDNYVGPEKPQPSETEEDKKED